MPEKKEVKEIKPTWKKIEDGLFKDQPKDKEPEKKDGIFELAKKNFSQVSVSRANNSARLFVVPFTAAVTTHGTADKVTRDYYVAVLPDTQLDSMNISFSSSGTVKGTMQLSLVIDLGNGSYSELTKPYTFNTPNTSATEIVAQTSVVNPGKPMYLRVTTYPEGTPATGWWSSGITINGSLACHVSDADRVWINSDPRSF